MDFVTGVEANLSLCKGSGKFCIAVSYEGANLEVLSLAFCRDVSFNCFNLSFSAFLISLLVSSSFVRRALGGGAPYLEISKSIRLFLNFGSVMTSSPGLAEGFAVDTESREEE